MYKNIKSQFCILITNIILHINYNSIKINKNEIEQKCGSTPVSYQQTWKNCENISL